MGNRYVDENRTKEIFLDDPDAAIWGFTKENLEKLGWVESDEPLRLLDKECPYCEGGKAFTTLRSVRLKTKCQACDGTGKQLIN